MSINKTVAMTDWDAGVRPKIEKINTRFPDLVWGTYNGHDPTKGRATDGMLPDYRTPAGNSRGWECARWLWANRETLGIWYVIFDGRIASRTYEAAGWRTYYPTSAAIRNSPDSAYHRNHPHVSFYELTAPRAFLPPYVVDPEQIKTFMVANATKAGQDDKLRAPLFRITTGVEIVTRTAADGKTTKWLVTESGYEYYLPFLVLESEYKRRPPKAETPEEPTLTKVRVASYNILGDKAGIKGGEGPLAIRLPLLIDTIKSAKASVLMLQECNKEAAGMVQGQLGADWMWSREGTRTVMWDKTVWNFEREETVEMIGRHSGDDKSFPLVLLTHTKGTDPIWFASVHFSSTSANRDVATSAQMSEERGDQARTVLKAFDGKTRAIGGGDLNSASQTKTKPKPILTAGGLKLMTLDSTFDSAKVDSFPNRTPGGQQIDEVFIKGARFLDGDIIQGKGSDHNLLVAEIELEK